MAKKTKAQVLAENSFRNRPWLINRNGRPPLLVEDINRELEKNGIKRVSPSQVAATYEQLLNLSIDQLKTLVTDKECPMLIKVVGSKMTAGKGIEIIEGMLDRAQGKAIQTQKVDVQLDVQPIITTIKDGKIVSGKL